MKKKYCNENENCFGCHYRRLLHSRGARYYCCHYILDTGKMRQEKDGVCQNKKELVLEEIPKYDFVFGENFANSHIQYTNMV